MKVLFVAVFNRSSTNWSQSDAFKKCGAEVIEFNYREVATQVGDARRDQILIDTCRKERPDLVVFSKCNEISDTVVDACNKVSKTVLWYMDPMNYNFNGALIAKIRKCDFTFCALWDSYERAKTYGGDKVYFLQEGFDHIQNYPIKTPYKNDVSFIGVLRNKRGMYHNAVGFRVINDAYGEKHSEAVSSTKINLNFTEGGTSDRTYKVLASKGFLLTEPWPNMEDDFTIGEDLAIFSTIDELKEQIAYYLENEEERLRIAENGYNTVQKFSRINWAEKILEITNGGS